MVTAGESGAIGGAADHDAAAVAREIPAEHGATASGIRSFWAGRGASVLVLALQNPPANALTAPQRAALITALHRHAGAAQAVVLIGAARGFSSATGLDLLPAALPGVSLRDRQSPSLSQLCLVLEHLPVPVVAALDGLVLAAGAEVALAAHARVAGPAMRFALPGISLGLSPEAGASQRLPRLVGAAEALAMLLQAQVVGPEEAVAIGLVDQMIEAEGQEALLAAALAHALRMAGPRPTATRRDGLGDLAAYTAAVAKARAHAARSPLPAPGRIIDCVEAALYLPFENGLALEAVAHDDLAASPEAAGLIAAARGERRLARQTGTAVRKEAAHSGLAHSGLALCGADGQMTALAARALAQGMEVFWHCEDPEARSAALRWIAAHLAEGPALGQAGDWRARLHISETEPEFLAATSGLTLAAIQQAPDQPGAQLVLTGQAFDLAIAPNWRMVEVTVPADAAPDTRQAAVGLLRRLGLSAVLLGARDAGLPASDQALGTQMAGAGHAALLALLALGVPRRAIVTMLERFGQAPPMLPDPVAPEGAPPRPMLAMGEAEIRNRWLGAMANAGCAALAEGRGLLPMDLDQIMTLGHGFPRWRGGPMHQAAIRGLMVLRSDLRRWQADDPVWQPDAMIDRLMAEGRRLDQIEA